jgi:hypothetical protein
MESFTLTIEEPNSLCDWVVTERVTGTLEEIVTKLESAVDPGSRFDNGCQYYNNPTDYRCCKDTTTGELYESTFYVPDWMSDEDRYGLGVEVIDPDIEEDLDPEDEEFQDEYNESTFMVLTEALGYVEEYVRGWLDNYYDTCRGNGQRVRWSLAENE